MTAMVPFPLMQTKEYRGLTMTGWVIQFVCSSQTIASRNMCMQRMEGIKDLTPTLSQGVGIVYFAIIESKNLQKSSAIQKISVTLSSVINGDIFSEHLLFRHCKGTENIAHYQIFNEL